MCKQTNYRKLFKSNRKLYCFLVSNKCTWIFLDQPYNAINQLKATKKNKKVYPESNFTFGLSVFSLCFPPFFCCCYNCRHIYWLGTAWDFSNNSSRLAEIL